MSAYSKGGVEPPLRDVICEPIIRTLMTRDGIREADLIGLLAIAKRRLDAAGAARRAFPPEEMSSLSYEDHRHCRAVDVCAVP